jgi:hypothetical protein
MTSVEAAVPGRSPGPVQLSCFFLGMLNRRDVKQQEGCHSVCVGEALSRFRSWLVGRYGTVSSRRPRPRGH